MGGLAPLPHATLEKFVRSVGCTFVRQTGSHRVYWRDDQVRPVIIPTYKAVPVFIIRNILRQLRISPEEFARIVNPAPRLDSRGIGDAPFGITPTSSPPSQAGLPWGGVKGL